MSAFTEVAPGVHRFADTCNVYVVTADADAAAGGAPSGAIAIDFGSGDVLDHLADLGLETLDAILMTHHHRDQGQGLPRAVAAGIPIFVPPVEQDLFTRVDEMWSARALYNDYNLRQDRFSLLDPVPVAGTVPEYRTARFGGIEVKTIPTPGHTMGSVTYLVDRGPAAEGQRVRVAFTGDLIYAPGKVWSLAATQWSYTENEGPAMNVLSCLLLHEEEPSILLPSHGEPMPDAIGALEQLADRMSGYVDSRRTHPWDLRDWLERPFVRLTDHLLLNRTANSCVYVLLSDSGAALFIDYGYDMSTGWPAGTDRAARRPWLASLPALKRDFGVTSVEVVLGTHYHDDHIAGFNLLRDVEGTEVWLPENVAPIMADPMRTDLPCQWFEPIPADRVLPIGSTVRWREYEFVTHELPGHTLYAAAFEFEVDGVRVLATGDQQTAEGRLGVQREILNYQYRNRFRRDDFIQSAALYRRVAPGLMITGHWQGREVDEDYLQLLTEQGDELAAIHNGLLPDDGMLPPADGNLVLVEPFYQRVPTGASLDYEVVVVNPYDEPREVVARLVTPDGWSDPSPDSVVAGAGETVRLRFAVRASATAGKRQRLAADVTVGAVRLGQAGDAVVDTVAAPPALDSAGALG
ncbi:MBL fold metallo-hydrolase [Leifsonia sp. RAF41]|uniref:MBL fold metallo-hydrolase n=1 Tax=Leifsonia sp. RAF41 TaxID=3233056 RepID=UPI003F947599